MDILASIIQYVLDLGAHIFVPLLLIIVAFIVRMKFKEAFTSALTLAVAFIGMSVVMNFMFDAINPAATSFVENTGIHLNAIDVGWAPLSSIAWAWPYAFLIFPLQIIINLIMLGFGWTSCLNVDLWNVWAKILTAVLVVGFTGSLPIAFLVAALEIIFELKVGDLTQKQTLKLTGIPGVTVPHSLNIIGVVLLPIDNLLKKIPLLNKKLDGDTLKDKIGVFAENHVIGFIVGAFIGIFAGYDFKGIVTLGIQAGTALLLFPMVAKLFMQALSPLSEGVSEFMKKKFPERDFCIGLDWPILAGRSEMWVVGIFLVPVMLLIAMIMPGNAVLPMGGIINLCLIVPALIITGGNILRMFILGIITTPLFLFVGTQFAPTITELATKVGTIDIPAGQMITWSGLEAPLFRYIFVKGAEIVNGNFVGIILVAVWLVLWRYYVKEMKAREAKITEELY